MSEGSPSVCIVGAGLAGILAGIKLKTVLGIENFTIFDDNDEVGGTWLVNHYPGAECDVPSHLYSYSFELNPEWSTYYASQAEILEYLKSIAVKHELYEFIQFKTDVKVVAWVHSLKKWKVTIFRQRSQLFQEMHFDIIINSCGSLRGPLFPKEFDSFTGIKMHTAAWDKSIDFKNKVVGVVGNGASAVQVIPELAKSVKELHCFQRSPTWVVPRSQANYSSFIRKCFAKCSLLLLLYRWFLFFMQELVYWVTIKDSLINRYAHVKAVQHLNKQVTNENLRNSLRPNYTIGCKRLAVSSTYLPTMSLPHVKLHSGPISQVLSDTIVADNTSHQLDILVLATGFRVQKFFAPMIIIDQNSEDLGAKWARTEPETYLGISVSSLPNFYFLLGAQNAIGHHSMIFMAECQMKFVCQCIEEMRKRNAKIVQLKPGLDSAFSKLAKEQLKSSVWTGKNCTSWFKDDNGHVTAFWAWTCTRFWMHTRSANFSKYHFI